MATSKILDNQNFELPHGEFERHARAADLVLRERSYGTRSPMHEHTPRIKTI